MISEAGLWQKVKRWLGTDRHHVCRVENSAEPGYPDVEYCLAGLQGHIELKQVERRPARLGTPLRVDHFTDEQRRWLVARAACGGRCHVLIQIGAEHPILFGGAVAALHLGRRSLPELSKLPHLFVEDAEGLIQGLGSLPSGLTSHRQGLRLVTE